MAQHNINKKQKLKFALIYGGKYHARFLKRGDIMANKDIKKYASKGGKTRCIPRALHEGILKIMGKELPCVVLEDGRRIITRSSVFKAFGRPQRGNKHKDPEIQKIPSFIDAKNLQPFITDEIKGLIAPVNYISISKKEATGYSAETLPIVCEIYLNAKKEGCLTPNQVVIAELSEVLLRTLSRVGIIGLVDEATGYQQVRPADALQAYLDKIIGKELTSWCKRFPDEFYSNIYKLRGWPEFTTSKNKYSCVGMYTNDIVYSRLGEDILSELKSKTPDTSKISMHQWLTVDTGHPLLSQHIHAIITLQRLALAQGFGWKRFIDMVDATHPKRETALLMEAA